jgi:hypothetical protein
LTVFRSNLYREGLVREAVERRRAAFRIGYISLLLVAAVLVAFLAGTGSILSQRIRSLEKGVAFRKDLLARGAGTADSSGLEIARTLVELRADRILWSGKFEEIQAAIPRNVILSSVNFTSSTRGGRKASLLLSGTVTGGGNSMEPVIRFVEALKASKEFSAPFSRIELGTAVENRFQVVCEIRTAEAADDETS